MICFNDSGENRKWRLTKWNLLNTSSINNQLKLRFLIIHSFWDRANFAWSKLLEIFEISPEVESVCCLYSAYATYVIFYAEMIIPCKKKKKKWKKIIFLSTSCEDPKLWRLTQNSLNTFTYIGINSTEFGCSSPYRFWNFIETMFSDLGQETDNRKQILKKEVGGY